MRVVTQTNITEYPLLSRGKVRDIYEVGSETLLIVTTDRMSAFDVIMEQPIPHKGIILNSITLFWMQRFASLVPNHLLAHEVRDFPAPLQRHADMLEGRSVLVRKARPLPVECIVRGHITGSGWKDYQKTGTVCGHALPAGLVESAKLETPLFTPSTKAEQGEHDENISVEHAARLVGYDTARRIERLSIDIFTQGRNYAERQGIIIADTKFEFGLINDELVLIDEVLTPDSSRFWPMQGYAPGKSQPSFDKQYLRDWLSRQDWDKTPPPPALPQDVIDETKNKYAEAYATLTGTTLALG